MTAGLRMRGILDDKCGAGADDIHWRTGTLDAGVRREWLEVDPPAGRIVEPVEEGRTLQNLLLSGEVDGLLAPKPPQAFLVGDSRLVRLLPDFKAAERDYHTRTASFPSCT